MPSQKGAVGSSTAKKIKALKRCLGEQGGRHSSRASDPTSQSQPPLPQQPDILQISASIKSEIQHIVNLGMRQSLDHYSLGGRKQKCPCNPGGLYQGHMLNWAENRSV